MAQGFSLKDDLFNATTVARLAGPFDAAGVFAAAPFQERVLSRMAPLELKERITMIAEELAQVLPSDFPAAAQAIRSGLPPPLDPARTDDDFGHFIYAPLGVYVETHGLERHRDLSLDLIEDITQRFSMEFSIRAFLNRWPEDTLARMQTWAEHPNYHVRRLVSEGTRPRLPWGQGIGIGPDRTLPLLDRLHADPTRYVTRSVANHLNDITKTDPDTVIARLADWSGQRRQSARERDWMARHALRGLIKAGHPGAMRHLGYRPDIPVVATLGISPDILPIGEAALVEATLTCETDAPLIVDYVIDFMKSNGTRAPKVFKLRTCTATAGIPLTFSKRHLFKKGATTFTHYPGPHRLHLQVNGRIVATAPFTLS